MFDFLKDMGLIVLGQVVCYLVCIIFLGNLLILSGDEGFLMKIMAFVGLICLCDVFHNVGQGTVTYLKEFFN